ncbi:hypothetical protein EDC01DRAFT_731102, partial [Geopyxis carbonaria]
MSLTTLHRPEAALYDIIIIPAPTSSAKAPSYPWLQPPTGVVQIFTAAGAPPVSQARSLLAALSILPLQRPLVFIAHSLGGLALKLALSTADVGLRDRVAGVVFFGTPHRGRDAAAETLVAGMVKALKAEKREVAAWAELVEVSMAALRSGVVVSFYETRKTSVGLLVKKIIVDKEAVQGGGGVTRGVDREHSDLVKYKSQKEANSAGVWDHVVEVLRTAEGMAAVVPSPQAPFRMPTPPRASTPRTPVPIPTPKTKEMDVSAVLPPPFDTLSEPTISRPSVYTDLAAALHPRHNNAIVLLNGPGGCGKTQAALTALQDLTPAPSLLWINATSLSAFTDALRVLLAVIAPPTADVSGLTEVEEMVVVVKEWLEARKGPWVLTLDGVPSDDDSLVTLLAALIPRAGCGRVLVTSRSPPALPTTTTVELGGMQHPEALQLLISRLGLGALSDRQSGHASALVQSVQHLPLAIDLLGAQIQELGRVRNLEDFLSVAPAALTDSSGDAVIRALWERSLARVAELNPTAHALLLFFALLQPEKISESLFAAASTGLHERVSPSQLEAHRAGLPQWLQTLMTLPWDAAALVDAVSTLSALRLVRRLAQTNGTVLLAPPPLLHATALAHVRALPDFAAWLTATLTFLSAAAATDTAASLDLASHFSHAYALAPPPPAVDLARQLPDLNWLALADLQAARGDWEPSLALKQSVLARLGTGSNFLAIAEAKLSLATTLHRMGRYDEAIVAADSALSIRASLLGDTDPATLEAAAERAGVSVSAHDYDAAVPELLQLLEHYLGLASDAPIDGAVAGEGLTPAALLSALQARATVLPASPHYGDILTSLNNLAVALSATHPGAPTTIALHKFHRAARHARAGPHDPETLRATQNLAFATGNSELMLAVLRDREQVLGAAHPDVLVTRFNLAMMVGGEEGVGWCWDVVERWEAEGRWAGHGFLEKVRGGVQALEARRRAAAGVD